MTKDDGNEIIYSRFHLDFLVHLMNLKQFHFKTFVPAVDRYFTFCVSSISHIRKTGPAVHLLDFSSEMYSSVQV